MMAQPFTAMREMNRPLDALKGQSFNAKSKHEAEKILQEIHSIARRRTIGKNVLCYIHTDGEIKGVGGSTLLKDGDGKFHSNLILNNFGLWLSQILKGTFAETTANLIDRTGTSRNIRCIVTSTMFNDSTFQTAKLHVGTGITAPARDDFFIETPLSTAPESGFFPPIPTSVYDPVNFNFKNVGSVNAGGSGTVNEAIMAMLWLDNIATSRDIVLYRDIISPGQAFTIGETIALEYTTQI